MVKCESPLERDFVYFLEINRFVLYYSEQPMKIWAKIGEETHYYTPDFFVQTHNEYFLVEVKDSSKFDSPEARLQRLIGQSFCRENPVIYKVITDKEIRSGSLLYNAKLLFKYSRIPTSILHYNQVFNILQNSKSLSLIELASQMGSLKDVRMNLPIVYNLIFKNLLLVDFSQPIFSDTRIIRWNEGNGQEGFYGADFTIPWKEI